MINITTPQELTKIYLVTNCYGDPNKIYIGKTKVCRKNAHQQKYGKEITYDYIDEINSFDKKYWKPLECFWIEYFKFLGFNLQNKNEGGNGKDFLTDVDREKISLGRRYKTPILQYDLEGNFIKEWRSPDDVKKTLNINSGGISNCCSGVLKTSFGYIWRHKSNPLPIDFIIKKWKGKSIIQYDLEGRFIKEWERVIDIKNELGFNDVGISACLNKRQETSSNFIWRYKEDPIFGNFKPYKRKGCKILQYTLEGELINKFDRIIDVKQFGFNPNGVSSCYRGELKTSQGYVWKKEN